MLLGHTHALHLQGRSLHRWHFQQRLSHRDANISRFLPSPRATKIINQTWVMPAPLWVSGRSSFKRPGNEACRDTHLISGLLAYFALLFSTFWGMDKVVVERRMRWYYKITPLRRFSLLNIHGQTETDRVEWNKENGILQSQTEMFLSRVYPSFHFDYTLTYIVHSRFGHRHLSWYFSLME